MKAVAKSVEGAEREARLDHISPLYHEALTLVERLHRRLLDVIKDEFDRRGRADINSVQALLLYNIGDKELTAGELRTRGYYLGSNVSYNLKKLVEMGYLARNANLKPGQAVVTSGLGGIFPRGIPVGLVVDSHTVEYGLYTVARVKLAANLSALEEVWVMLEP